jgi:hypothetical protein
VSEGAVVALRGVGKTFRNGTLALTGSTSRCGGASS